MSDLVEFAKTGNLARVQECVLKDGNDVNFRCPPDGSAALYWAACSGHVPVCDWLINYGAEIDMTTTKSGSSALHGAADRGHYDCVTLLLRRGSEIDRQTTANGDTALHLAAYRGDLSVCRLLLDHGAGTSIANKQGRTALEESQIKDHNEISRLIAQHNLFRERQDCLSEKMLSIEEGASDFDSVKNSIASKSENFFSTSSSQFTSEFSDPHRRKQLHSEGPLSQLPTLFPSKSEQLPFKSASEGFVHAPSPSASEGSDPFEGMDDLGLPMDNSSRKLVRQLRTKISTLESYTDTLLIELTVKDASLERLRSDNAMLRQKLEAAEVGTPKSQKVPSTADMCATSDGGGTNELEELRRQCRELEQVVFEVSKELRNADGRSRAPKAGGNSESHA